MMVVVHVGGLWITSPPDMIDALLFTSPTPFSPFGVIAMWAIFAVAVLAAFRRRLGLRTWRIAHMSLAAAIKVMADLRVWRRRATSRGESPARQ